MYRVLSFSLVLVFLIACSQKQKTSLLTGTINSTDGSIPKLAHVHVFPFGDNPYSAKQMVQMKVDGSFEINLPDEEYLGVMVTAADHHRLIFPLIRADRSKKTDLKITIERNKYVEPISSVRITGDWNKFRLTSASKMKRQKDGTFVFERKFEADSVAYQIMDVVKDGRTVNGTASDSLVYDGGGDYLSVLYLTDNKLRIVFDPSKLIETDPNEASVKVMGDDPTLQEIIRMALRTDQDKNMENTLKASYTEKNKNLVGFKYDREPFKKFLQPFLADQSNNLLNRFAFLQLAKRIAPKDSDADSLYRQIIEHLPLTDPLWAAEPMGVSYIFINALGEEQAQEHFRRTYKSIPNKKVQAGVLVNLGLMAKRKGNVSRQKEIYSSLREDYKEIGDIEYYVGLLDPEQKIAAGKKVPEFKSMDLDEMRPITDMDFLGKTYLIDFWATWCAPCVEEMPNLHAAYEKYKDKNFTIMSFSYDHRREDIRKFRKEKWAMPWHHIFLTGDLKKQISKKFEVDGIPKPILVNPEGIIIATEFDLRGDELDKTLSKYLNK